MKQTQLTHDKMALFRAFELDGKGGLMLAALDSD